MIERPDYHARYSSGGGEPNRNDFGVIDNNVDTLVKPKVNGLNGIACKEKWTIGTWHQYRESDRKGADLE